MITRTLVNTILKSQNLGFINIIYGARRVGKTFLLDQLKEKLTGQPLLFLNGDTQETRDLLSTSSEIKITQVFEKYPLIFIDEAQRIGNVTLMLKILIDKYPEKQIFITGSSSLSLAAGVHETLTGRTNTYKLYPLSFAETTNNLPDYQKNYLLDDLLIYGGYPYLLSTSTPSEKQNYLKDIVDNYLLGDILKLERVDNPDNLIKLCILLAYQLGSEVSLNELSKSLMIEVKTINRYLNLLKQGFIVFEIGSYSRNLRKEISKGKKYYFYDLGIRNSLINQFASLDIRNDKGALWENFLAVERLKKNEYQRNLINYYFWRNYEQAEIDWLEEKNGLLSAYEFKWQTKNPHTPKAFFDLYQIRSKLVSTDNFEEFI
jgi:uncharacterized protein